MFKKQRKMNRVWILLTILLSYIALSVYLPSHLAEMNNTHNMDMPKENCPFIVADNVICSTTAKRDSEVLNINNYIDNNIIHTNISLNVIINIIYFSIFYLFLLFNIKNKSLHGKPILIQELFSDGTLNSKAH